MKMILIAAALLVGSPWIVSESIDQLRTSISSDSIADKVVDRSATAELRSHVSVERPGFDASVPYAATPRLIGPAPTEPARANSAPTGLVSNRTSVVLQPGHRVLLWIVATILPVLLLQVPVGRALERQSNGVNALLIGAVAAPSTALAWLLSSGGDSLVVWTAALTALVVSSAGAYLWLSFLDGRR